MLTERSIKNLGGVDKALVECVNLAHAKCLELGESYNFTVIEGVRTVEKQREYVNRGASQTMKSYHITGQAVDLALFDGTIMSNDLSKYAVVADCMDEAADELGIEITWGAVWDKRMDDYEDAQKEFKQYVKRRAAIGRKPFVDAVHFQIEPYDDN